MNEGSPVTQKSLLSLKSWLFTPAANDGRYYGAVDRRASGMPRQAGRFVVRGRRLFHVDGRLSHAGTAVASEAVGNRAELAMPPSITKGDEVIDLALTKLWR
jgi:hypothetical protein